MSVLSLSYWESDVYWRQNNKHFAELVPQNGGKQLIWRNHVTLALCIDSWLMAHIVLSRALTGATWRSYESTLLPCRTYSYRTRSIQGAIKGGWSAIVSDCIIGRIFVKCWHILTRNVTTTRCAREVYAMTLCLSVRPSVRLSVCVCQNG